MKIPGSKPILFGTLGLVGIGAYTYNTAHSSGVTHSNAQAIQDILPRMERAEIYEGSGNLYDGSG